MSRPFVAICVPNTGTLQAKTAQALAHLCATSIFECDLSVINGEGYSVASARNRMVLGQLQEAPTVTHVMFIDSDMVFPADGLIRLLRHDKDMVAATYVKRKPPHEVIGKLRVPLDLRSDAAHGIKEACELPAGFMLIKRSVFERLPPPWFVETFDFNKPTPDNLIGLTTEDIYFCRLCIKAGITFYMDIDLTFEIGHIGANVNTCVRPNQQIKLAS